MGNYLYQLCWFLNKYKKRVRIYLYFCREDDDNGDDDIIFEDFARLRLKGETDA